VFDVVVAADLDWGIGRSSGLPWPRLAGDMQHFRRITCAASEGRRTAIVMGRKTWESSEVAGKPLPRRLNVVVTRRSELVVPDGVVVASSLDDGLAAAARGPGVETVFVVGGAEIFREAFGKIALRWTYLTRVEGHFECDTHIPDLDRLLVRDAWDGERHLEDNGVRYRIERLRRRDA
jgi:dihydrofolate reductase/thymidylate synthase